MTIRWGGDFSALLLAALLPAACMKSIDLSRPLDSTGGGGSGFDAGPVGGGNGAIDGGGNADARLHCTGSASLTTFTPAQAKPAIMFALDRSQSMTKQLGNSGTRFSVTTTAITATVNAYSALVSFGYVEFPTGDPSCSMACCAAGFPPSSGSGQSSNFGAWFNQCTSSQSLTCNGPSDTVPTGQAMNRIANAFRHNTTNTLYALLLTDGPPTKDCPLDTSDQQDACDQTATLISNMNTVNGIATFVMGVGDVPLDSPSNAPTTNGCLNKLAFSGGHPVLNAPAAYMLATTDTSVRPQIDAIVTNAICQADIDDPSFDSTHPLEVDFNGSMIPFDPINGWTLDKTRLTFNGSSCTNLIAGLKTTSHHVQVKQCIDMSHPFQPPSGP